MCVTVLIDVSTSILGQHVAAHRSAQEPHRTLTIPMRMDLRSLKPVTVSAGEIAERGSFVDLGDVRNSRTDRKHGCVSANVSRFRVEVGGKPRTVCLGTAGVVCVSVGRVARYSSQQRRKSLERVFETQKREPAVGLEDLGALPTETNSPKRGLEPKYEPRNIFGNPGGRRISWAKIKPGSEVI